MNMRMNAALLALVTLTACGGGEKKPAAESAAAPAVAAAPAAVSGEEVYTRVCQVCHQQTGLGVEGGFPPLAGSEWLNGKPEVPIAIVLHGLQGEITVKGKPFNSVMAPWGGALSDEEIAAVLTHERSSWGNSAPAVTAEQVKAVRAQYANHAPWTVADLKPLQ